MKKTNITDGLAELTANSVNKVRNVAEDLTARISDISKIHLSGIQKDVDEAIDWVAKRNSVLRQESEVTEVTSFETLPDLGKVIFGGEAGINELPVDKQSKYIEFFKKNGSRITMLTAVNPALGLGVLGAEAAANGLVSAEASVGSATIGTGLIGLSKLAAVSVSSVSRYASVASMLKIPWYVPGLQYVGTGLFALGTGAMLFKAIEKLPQGKLLTELFTETQKIHNDCYILLENNIAKIGSILSDKMKDAAEKLEAASKKIAISFDDIVHSDQNLRIMQYNEILLKLYNNQKAIIDIQADIVEKLSQIEPLIAENNELNKKINECKINLQTLVCGAEYLK